jgi:hypothetical protein
MKLLTFLFACLTASAAAQQPAAPAAKPLPDIATLLRDVESHQKELDTIKHNYIFKEDSHEEELGGDDKIKKTVWEEREIFYIGKQEISRLLRKDGHNLTADEAEKEKERVDKKIEKAKKKETADEQKKDDDITVDTFLRICKFTNPRRESRNGRDAIVFDFSGNPDEKAHGLGQTAIKKLAGTLWVDETGRAVSRLEAHFEDSFKVGGGLLASLQKGSWFVFEQQLVNDEVWLPTSAEASMNGRVLLFKSFHGHYLSRFSDYRKFRSKTNITLAEPGETTQK